MPTVVATPGASNANSFILVTEATSYFDERLPLPVPWIASGDAAAQSVIQATRALSALARPHKVRRRLNGADYLYTARQWTGVPATTTQRLAWPRIGMLDANGNVIDSTVIPEDLKFATAELAGQLRMADTTLDNDTSVAGITSVRAGSVGVTFKDEIENHVLPDYVWSLMPPSWFTDEYYEPMQSAMVDLL